MKKYWLTLFPETFLWEKKDKILIYNTNTQIPTEIKCSPEIKNICQELHRPENLYTVEIEQNQLANSLFNKFIQQVKKTKSGVLIEKDGINQKPISYAPIFKLQQGIEQLKWEDKLGIGGITINNLHEITLHVNGSKNGSNSFFKQIHYPVKAPEILDVDSIKTFISGCKGGNLHKINIVGNVSAYPDFNLLLDWLLLSSIHDIEIYVLQNDFVSEGNFLKKWSTKNIRTKLIIHKISSLSLLIDDGEDILLNVDPLFVVTSKDDVEAVADFMTRYGTKDYDIVALFTGKNIDFFEQYVYSTLEDIKNINLSKREIFVNMAMNIHSFGKLTIMPDGNIYANVNNAPLGCIYEPVYNLILKEMTKGCSWLHIRNMKPCCDCIYQWLCPSPSNYEKAIGKPNLCHIHI
jgi:pseudo-rSAM protein